MNARRNISSALEADSPLRRIARLADRCANMHHEWRPARLQPANGLLAFASALAAYWLAAAVAYSWGYFGPARLAAFDLPEMALLTLALLAPPTLLVVATWVLTQGHAVRRKLDDLSVGLCELFRLLQACITALEARRSAAEVDGAQGLIRDIAGARKDIERAIAALKENAGRLTEIADRFAQDTGVSLGFAISQAGHPPRTFYIPVPIKFTLTLFAASAWMALSIWLSLPWLRDLTGVIGIELALYLVVFIAYVPGFMNAFLVTSLLLDRRPPRTEEIPLPGVSVLVPCYNEASGVSDTILSLARQAYDGAIEYLIIDDGSRDETLAVARQAVAELPADRRVLFRVIARERNSGKAAVLNHGLAMARYSLIATVDGDCWLAPNALKHIVQRYLSDPPDTRAVAGTVLVRNSRKNWITRVQEWDYFQGIASIKRVQSMFHGTLVAQGAFSLYDANTLRKVGGWPQCVGEDIVVSWAILKEGYRIGHCEDAITFTNVPETLSGFIGQRRRWSRGLVEAFLRHGSLLFKPRMSMLFIWWNLLFLPVDTAYTLGFVPGLLLALFGYYYIVGIMTLILLPLAMCLNTVILGIESRMFKAEGLRVRRNLFGFFSYVFGYSLILQPVSMWGYFSELLGLKKEWGTK